MTRMTRGGAISNDPRMTDQGRISVIDGQSGECWIDREAGGRCTGPHFGGAAICNRMLAGHGTHDDMMRRMSGLGHRVSALTAMRGWVVDRLCALVQNQQVLNTQQEHARRNEERKARNRCTAEDAPVCMQ